MGKRDRLWWAMLLLCWWPSLMAQPYLHLDASTPYLSIGRHVSVWEDTGRQAGIEEILSPDIQSLFVPSDADKLNFGYNPSSAFWVRIPLTNRARSEMEWLLEIDYPPLDSLTFYARTSDGSWSVVQTGELLPFTSRPLPTRTFVLPLRFTSSDPHVFYLRIQTTGSVQVPLVVHEKLSFYEREVGNEVFYGIFYGIILIMAVYNLSLGYALRDRSYLAYGLSVFLALLFLATLRGHAQQYLWPGMPQLSNPVIGFSTFAVFGCNVLFSILFLKTSKNYPFMHRLSVAVCGVLALGAVMSLLVSYAHTAKVSALMGLVMPLVLLINGWVAWRSGNKAARFFVLGWLLYLIGVLILSMVFIGKIPNNFFTMNAVQFGLLAEVVLLSFALADRINIYRNQNEQLVRNQNAILEQKVTERTHELRQKQQEVLAQNEELQQQAEEIRTHRDAIQEQHRILEENNRQIHNSIRAAKVIQEAILQEPSKHLSDFFEDYALLYAPKDVVSGDFYWATPLLEGDGILVAAVDCTGHGVPGAFMSLIGHTLLDKITVEERIFTPGRILTQLDHEVRHLLPHNTTGSVTGMDVSIIRIERQEGSTYAVALASAKSPVLYYNPAIKEVTRVRCDHVSVGQRLRKQTNNKIDFQEIQLQMQSSDVIYLGSDGLADQNNYARERFGTLRLLELTQAIAHLPLSEQKEKIRQTINAFRQGEPLRDDILWMGLRLP